jgi:hypothetical protein
MSSPRSRFTAYAQSTFRVAALSLVIFPWDHPKPVLAQPQPGAPPPAPQVRLEGIRPGTIVGQQAPAGWTHLVAKSWPRLPDDQKRLVNEMTARLAVMFFTAITADVAAEDVQGVRQFRLARLGFGTGTRVRGQDMIVTPATETQLGADLGFFGRRVLAEVAQRQQEMRLVAHSPTAALIDTVLFMPRGPVHRKVILRYAFLVDPQTGRLDTLVWRIDLDARGAYEGAVGAIEWLPPGLMVDAVMQVDAREFHLGVPSERAFAVVNLPSGQQRLDFPADLKAIAGLPRLTAEQARLLDAGLREQIARMAR